MGASRDPSLRRLRSPSPLLRAGTPPRRLRGASVRMRGRSSRPVIMHGAGLFFPPLPHPPAVRGARAGPGAVLVGQSRVGPRWAGERGAPRCCNFFFQQRREGGGLNFVMSQISFLWLLLPALLPRLPSARTLAFFFSFFPCYFYFFKLFSPVSNIFACSASSPGCAGGGGEGFSWLSTFPSSAACPAEAPAPPRLAALPRPRRGVRPGADALVLPAEEPASCLGTTGMISRGKAGGGETQPSSFNPDSLFHPFSVVDKIKRGYLFEKVVKRLVQCDLGAVV